MREQNLRSDPLGRLVPSDTPFHDQLGQFLGRIVRQAERTDLALRGLALRAQLLRRMHARLGIGAQKLQKIFTAKKADV